MSDVADRPVDGPAAGRHTPSQMRQRFQGDGSSRETMSASKSLGPIAYPATRLRRTRQADWARRLVAEARLSVDDLIWPLFLIEGKDRREPVASMPGVDRLSVDQAVRAAEQA